MPNTALLAGGLGKVTKGMTLETDVDKQTPELVVGELQNSNAEAKIATFPVEVAVGAQRPSDSAHHQ